MSNTTAKPSAHLANATSGHWWVSAGALRITAIVAMCIAAVVFAYCAVAHLQALVADLDTSSNSLVTSAMVFTTTLVLVLLVEILDLSRRFRHPERQVRAAMQRIRAGDVGFRLAIHRGQPLGRLLYECNGLLEWLNHNPPSGVRVDGDVFDIGGDEEDEL